MIDIYGHEMRRMKRVSNTNCKYQLSWAIMVDNKLKSIMTMELNSLPLPKMMLCLARPQGPCQ